ncbi:MAG: class I SAM-dependent methyltransferase [Cellvibrionaceae bacterium]
MIQLAQSKDCPLCQSISCYYLQDKHREYWQCERCHLVWVPSCFYLSPTDEKAYYDTHENNPNDAGYRNFLSRLATPLLERLPPESKGLDYGSGPGPTLSRMLSEAGHPTAIYDPYYANIPAVLEKKFDFITCTEVIEHIYDPIDTIEQWLHMLKPNGIIGLMTKLVIDKDRFANWHYKNDPTHVCFYSTHTFEWLAQHYDFQVEFVGADVIFLYKG